jgi:hypothetical protein
MPLEMPENDIERLARPEQQILVDYHDMERENVDDGELDHAWISEEMELIRHLLQEHMPQLRQRDAFQTHL